MGAEEILYFAFSQLCLGIFAKSSSRLFRIPFERVDELDKVVYLVLEESYLNGFGVNKIEISI